MKRYLTGNGVGRDCDRASYFYEKAASKGLPQSMTNLGTLYRQGNGVARCLPTAAKWYARAANLGDETARAMLAEVTAAIDDAH